MSLHTSRKRSAVALAAGLGLTFALAACGDDSTDPGAGGGEGTASDIDCAPYEEFGDLDGTTVNVYTSIIAPEDQPHIDSWVPFEDCTGVDVVYEGSKEFEAQLVVRIQSGNPPDIAYLPQPGLLRTIVADSPDAIVPAPDAVVANIDKSFGAEWKDYGTVDGTFYAAPLGSNVKSFVWYSPAKFSEAGYEVPETWDDMLALSDEIAAAGGKPWCLGIGSGDATGWPLTDWMEDVMLRLNGAEVYDEWTNHEIPFNDPQVADALAMVGDIVKNEDYVNGGLGDVQSIAATEFQEGGLPILDGSCFMHRQASFYQANWPEGTTVAEDGDVFAFYLPPINAGERPLLVAGEFVAAFADRPEVQAFQAYLASPEWANAKAAVSGPGWVSANLDLDASLLSSPIDRLAAELFQDEEATLHFDASDLMPGAVGSGSFWAEMTEWVASDKSDADVLDAIESSWP